MTDLALKPQARIARRLFKAVLGFSTVLTLVFTCAQGFYDYKHNLQSINKQFEEINRTLSPAISTALWGFDRQTLVSQAEGIIHFPHIKYVEIRSNDEILAAAGQRPSGNSLGKEYPLSHLYNEQMIVLGTLHLEADTSEVIHDIFGHVSAEFFFQFLTIGLISLFLLLMFNRLVTRHIAKAASHFRAFDIDGKSPALKLEKKQSGDEIDILAEAFNTLQEKLQTSYRQVRESEQRFKLATASGKLGVWDWNVKDDVIVCDDRMFELYAISSDGIPADRADLWVNRMHPDDRERVVAEYQAALTGERNFHTVFRICHPDGTVLHIKANALVIRGAGGTAERMIGINTDISEQIHAEEEKKTFETQLQQAQKMESIGRLAGGVAHDFNNMLSVILGHAELGLRHLKKDDPTFADLVEIKKAAERSADLTRQLLAFARKQTVTPKLLDLNDTVSGMLKMLQRLIGEDINLTWQPASKLWQVRIDPSQVDQILANLCVNARDAIENTGHISIQTENCTVDDDYCATHLDAVTGDYVRLTVSDDGIGMDRQTQTHIFEPFFTTKGIGKGTGLGLATVYGAVKQNNGFINIYSEPGLGTSISIYLPRHKGNGSNAVMEGTPPPVPRGQETILLVEDEPAILEVTAKQLTEQGYAVLQSNSAEEAIQLATLHSGSIHLLLTDVIMPEMNGRDLAEHLLLIDPQMKRLFMSGYTSDVLAPHGVLDEEVPFIQKPFTLQHLAKKVREVLDAKCEDP